MDVVEDFAAAVDGIEDGMTILVGGFGDCGLPKRLIDALVERGPRNLTVVANNAGTGTAGIAKLLTAGMIRKVVCSYPRQAGSYIFNDLWAAGKIELELVPQGTLNERIRAGGAGILGFYTATGVDTRLTEGREIREFGHRRAVLETPIRGDFALVKARASDTMGNLVYSQTARANNPVMCTAADVTVVEVDELVEAGGIDPEIVVTPGLYVDRVVVIPASGGTAI